MSDFEMSDFFYAVIHIILGRGGSFALQTPHSPLTIYNPLFCSQAIHGIGQGRFDCLETNSQ